MTESRAVVRFPEPVPAAKKPAPKYKTIRVGRTLYRVVPDAKASNGFQWLQECGKNAFGEADWKSVSQPATKDVIAALYAAS